MQPLPLACDTREVGGKAANLGEMIRLGLAIPSGFVITDAAFQLFLDENQLRQPITAALADLQATDWERMSEASDTIQRLMRSATIPAPVLDAIREAVTTQLSDQRVIVRSSAVGEDSQEAAFAGQLDSFLNIESESSLIEAICACWASYWSPRVLFYQLSKEVYLRGMGVIVQNLVASRLSGILFTRSPWTTGERESMLVEYCFGHGDELASGKINPGRFRIDRCDLSWFRETSPQDPLPKNAESENPAFGDDACLFSKSQIELLGQAALELESHFGHPQDIEWTIDQTGRLFFVQTRPITVDSRAANDAASSGVEDNGRSPPSGQRVLWSNANVNENFPDPISPLLYSIASAGYYNYFRNLALALGFDRRRIASMEYPFRNIIGVHGARMYYNLTNIHSLLRMAPYGARLAQWFDDFVGVDQAASTNDATLLKIEQAGRATRTLELVRTLLKTTWLYLFVNKRIAHFERVIDAFASETTPEELAAKSLDQLLVDLRTFMDIRCNRWLGASLADTSAMVSYGLLKRMLARDFPDSDQAGLHNSLLKGLNNVVSGRPIIELWNLSQLIREDPELLELFQSQPDQRVLREIEEVPRFGVFNTAFKAFVRDWGFRCSGELMLTVASFQERPVKLLEMLRAYVESKSDSPVEQLERQAVDRELQTHQVLRTLRRRKLLWGFPWPNRATLLKRVLKRCHQSIALRERARLKQALLYSRCRQIALAIGDRLVTKGDLHHQDDIFFLTYHEIDALLAGSAMFPRQTEQLVSLRKTAHQQLSALHPPATFILPAGEYWLRDEPTGEAANGDANGQLVGVGACGGQVTATARILTDVTQCRKLKQGDVLVTRQTDPGWGPVFFLIKGLVMERGGMLSHGAILAREYGIPTVVGVHEATSKIAPGQQICVNGDRGIVQLID
ncbi:MAG: PEP/pyruvate-binding domain-containing protein [Pirellulaceae bacterium]